MFAFLRGRCFPLSSAHRARYQRGLPVSAFTPVRARRGAERLARRAGCGMLSRTTTLELLAYHLVFLRICRF